MPADTTITVIVTARNEADRLPATLAALADAFPGARVVVADDGSADGSAQVARQAGAEVVGGSSPVGKGGAATLGGQRALKGGGAGVFVLCDGDLGDSARHLPLLAEAVWGGDCDLAVAVFAARVGGGVGLAVGFARWAVQRLCGLRLDAPISGQRALSGEALRTVLPFAPRFGMEIAMTVDATRAGLRVREVQLPLTHRATGRSLRGFLHRGRQLRDFAWVYLDRRSSGRA